MTGPSPSGELWHRNRDEAVQYRDFKATGKRERAKDLANSLPFPVSEESEECCRVRDYVAVGTPVARRPPHRTGRAALPHPAPTLGDDAEPREKIPGGLTYLLERALRTCPALCPERVAL